MRTRCGKVATPWHKHRSSQPARRAKDDPNLAAIRVEADTAEAWTSASTAVGRVFNFVTAALTGDSGALGVQKHFDLRNGLRTEKSR